MTEIAGYRVLRSAARGSRCRILVGHADGETVVLKVGHADDPAFAAEAQALARAAGEHVVALLDAAADDAQTVLVLPRLGGGTLLDLLERRQVLSPGEAVTLLAPVAETVERMHAAGVAHGDLTLESVCLDDDGAPILVGFGRAVVFEPGAPEVVLRQTPGVLADRRALRELVAIVLGRVAGARGDAVRRLLASLADPVAPAALAAALYDVAVPEPVATGEPDAPVEGLWRVVEPQDAVDEPTPPPALPDWLLAFVPDPFRARVSEISRRALETWGRWSGRRRRVVLGAAAAAATVVLALVAVPAPEREAVATPVPDATATEAPEARPPEDPLDALPLLLETRERCIRDLSLLCLDAVDQPGSAAYDEDRALIAAIEAGGEVPIGSFAPGEPTLVERLGDSALVALAPGSDPGSILLMNTDAGWRIRDFFPAPPGDPIG